MKRKIASIILILVILAMVIFGLKKVSSNIHDSYPEIFVRKEQK